MLVIIGLIVGGIVVGKEMIVQATNRKMMSDFDKYFAAHNAFKLKYNCIAGDCAKASQYGLQVSNCNNEIFDDGLIGVNEAGYGPTAFRWGVEIIHFFRQLSASGMIGESYNSYTNCNAGQGAYGAIEPGVTIPKMANNAGGFAPMMIGGINYLRTGISKATYSNVTIESNEYSFSPIEALYISSKMSDGSPGFAGRKLYATSRDAGGTPNNNQNTAPTFSVSGGTGCVVGSAPLASGQTFNTAISTRVCNLFIALP